MMQVIGDYSSYLRDASTARKPESVKRKSFVRMNCSIAQSLEVVGEWWTLLIVREALLFGARRFGEFQEAIGIADNILTERLRKLTARGVFERISAGREGHRGEYHLTEMGRALLPVLVALMQWGDRWIGGTRRPPVKILEKLSGAELAEIRVESSRGVSLTPDDIILVAGPGATAETKERLKSKLSQEIESGRSTRTLRAHRHPKEKTPTHR